MSKPLNSPKKIVLADDSVTMHRAVKLGLKKEPFEVICCDNGADAWRIVKIEKPDAVLADLDMPGMTGAELCQKIKADPELKHIPVILVCGSFDQVDEKHLETVPSDARLWKPFETHVLTSLLTKLLSATSETSSAETTQFAKVSSEPTSLRDSMIDPRSAFESTQSQHIHEPQISDAYSTRQTTEQATFVDDSRTLFESFQDLPERTGSTQSSFEATQINQSSDQFENLWGPASPTMTIPTPVYENPEKTSWPTQEEQEKSFSTEVFEAVESREFSNDFDEEPMSSMQVGASDPTQIQRPLPQKEVQEAAEPTSMFSEGDLRGYREETSQSFIPHEPAILPRKPTVTQGGVSTPPPPPPLRTSIVEHTSVLATNLATNSKAGMSEEEIRKIIRDEIQVAISGWLKNKLHLELERVIEEIDQE